MLSSHGHPFFGLSQDLYWSGLWPEVRPLLHQRDNVLRDLHCSLQLMDSLQDHFMEDTCFPHALSQPHTKVQPFVLRLDAHGFSPEELSVGQGNGLLRVQGRKEKNKKEDGCSSHMLQEWTQELSLPEGLKTEDLHCYMSPDGTIFIQDAPSTLRDRESCPSREASVWSQPFFQHIFQFYTSKYCPIAFQSYLLLEQQIQKVM
uniref:SHSP domain-containing protein n=1 Tax=Neogobius melanostomus TaxID=47308 RepID=A0A8C6SMZ8_9GOBI